MGLIGSDVNMHFMDPTEHLPISPIYHVIWYNWCSMLWRSTGRARLLVRVGAHGYRVLAFSACLMLGSNCSTPSLSCRNPNLYSLALKYFAVENGGLGQNSELIWNVATGPWQWWIRNFLLLVSSLAPLERGPGHHSNKKQGFTGSWLWAWKESR